MIFSLRNISKQYDNKEILTIEEFDIKEGEIYCITGPNGAGKTTLLEILAGLQKPSNGTIIYKGKEELPRGFKEIVMVLQGAAIFNTTVNNNIAFGLKANRIEKNKQKEKIDKALRLVHLETFKSRRAITLSGGEKQRLAIARALALEPEVLLLDEPTSGLDAYSRNAIIDILKYIHKHKKITIIIASHDIDFVFSVATKIFSLHRGKHVPLSIENVFSGVVINNTRIKIDNIEFFISGHKNGEVNVVISPESIVLSKQPLTSSMRNKFEGKIIRLEKNQDKVKIWVDIGIVLCCAITFESFRKMMFHLDEMIWIAFKATAIKCY